MKEVESTGLSGWENVEAKGKGNIFSSGNQSVGKDNYGSPAEGQPSKVILRSVDLIL